jgi:hypothetical protein
VTSPVVSRRSTALLIGILMLVNSAAIWGQAGWALEHIVPARWDWRAGLALAAWPPLALLLTVELISRVPVARWWLSAVRLVATAAISGIAAYVSYFHMAAVVSRYGERAEPVPACRCRWTG